MSASPQNRGTQRAGGRDGAPVLGGQGHVLLTGCESLSAAHAQGAQVGPSFVAKKWWTDFKVTLAHGSSRRADLTL